MGGAMDGGRFDVARAVARGCRLAWAGRGLVARVAAPALAANLLCLAAAGALGASLEADPLRTTLIFLPAFFAEGWAAATLARLAVLGPGAALARTREGLRARTAGMVAYVLAALGLAGPDAVVVGYALAAAMEVAVVVVSTLAVAAGVDEVFRGADAR
jgi:hypothetical protein